jgi:DNA primase
LTELGYPVQQLVDCGLLTALGRDAFCRRIVFPFPGNLYGRSLGAAARHRFLAGAKGGLYAWDQVRQARTVILVEGLFDLAVLWQAGFPQTTCAYGTHLNAVQWEQLCDRADRTVYIAFDQDGNGAGQDASADLAWRLRAGGREARQVKLPEGYDPNRYFTAGATAADFARCLELAR